MRRSERCRSGIDIGQHHAHVAARDASFGPQLWKDGARLVDGHRKSDVARPLADGRVDADDFASAVDERSAAVAEVDGGVGLNVVVEAAVEQLAAEIADHTNRDRVLVGQRIADGADPFADAQRLRVAHRRHRQIPRLDLDERDVGIGVDAEHAGLQAAAVGELHHDPLGVLDDVVVGQDLPVGLDDEPAARLRPHRGGPWTELDCSRRTARIRERRAGGVRRPRVVASMLTTAGLMLSATSAKFTSPASIGRVACRCSGRRAPRLESTTCGCDASGAASAWRLGRHGGSRRARRDAGE